MNTPELNDNLIAVTEYLTQALKLLDNATDLSVSDLKVRGRILISMKAISEVNEKLKYTIDDF